MKKEPTKNKSIKIVSYILLIVLIAGLCFATWFFTNGLKTDFKTLFVYSNGNKVISESSNNKVTLTQPLNVEIKQFFDVNDTGYKVRIVPKTNEIDFTINIDNKDYKFSEIEDVTNGFIVEFSKKSFSVALPGNGKIQDIFTVLYPGKTVTVDDNSLDLTKDLFTLIISANNSNESILINFSIGTSVDSVQLDKSEIVF